MGANTDASSDFARTRTRACGGKSACASVVGSRTSPTSSTTSTAGAPTRRRAAEGRGPSRCRNPG
jgi:hypothetical protein